MTKFQASTILTSQVMDRQVHAIGKAIRTLSANPVTFYLYSCYSIVCTYSRMDLGCCTRAHRVLVHCTSRIISVWVVCSVVTKTASACTVAITPFSCYPLLQKDHFDVPMMLGLIS